MTKEIPSPSEILEQYLHNVDSISTCVPAMMMMIIELQKGQDEKVKLYLKENGKLKKSEDGVENYLVPVKAMAEFKKISRRLDQFLTSSKLIPRNFLVSFVSEYDAFLGALMKCFHAKKPELLNGVEKQITFSDLMEFKSIDAAKEHILEKDVESMLRKSHSEHFEIMEKKFKITLRKDLESWPSFIEVMERRNLFVHCDGKVSSQYIKVCTEHKVKLDEEVAVSSQLSVSPDYLANAHKIMREIAIKLTHVLWRKVFPEERERADGALIDLGYELIQRGSYPLAINILEFAISLPSHHSDTLKRMFYINLAQAYKYSGDSAKCATLINKLDWSSVSNKFKLAVSVLREEYSDADRHMANVAKIDEISEQNFLEWTLFKDYRETAGFKREFKERYKKDPPKNSSATVSKAQSTIALEGSGVTEVQILPETPKTRKIVRRRTSPNVENVVTPEA